MHPDVARLLDEITSKLDYFSKQTGDDNRDVLMPPGNLLPSHDQSYRELSFAWIKVFQEAHHRAMQAPPSARVLSGFGAVVDRTCYLDPLEPTTVDAICLWVEQEARNEAYTSRSDEPLNKVMHPADILTMLCEVFKRIGPEEGKAKSGGGKSEVKSQQLCEALVRRGFPLDAPRLGGLPAIVSDILGQFGVDARYCSIYHPQEAADLFQPSSLWLNPNSDSPLKPVSARDSGQPDHPVRYGIALAFKNGAYPFCGNAEVVVGSPDRQLLVLKTPIGKHEWTTWRLEGMQPGPDERKDWPNHSAFLKWYIDGDELVFEALDEPLLQMLGQQHACVIIGSPQLRDFKQGAPQKGSALELLERQLRLLRNAGATVHLELSGDDASGSIPHFREFLKDAVDSIGINSEELPYYAQRLANSEGLKPNEGAAQDPAQAVIPLRLTQAQAFARALGVERLYVHGNDIDLILRRDTSHEAMEMDWRADAFAKLAVLAATILRNSANVDDYIGRLPESLSEDVIASYREGVRTRHNQSQLQQIARLGGVHQPDEPRDYWVAFVPCLWFPKDKIPPRFSATGAGDITSGVSFVYSGFHETRRGRRAAGEAA